MNQAGDQRFRLLRETGWRVVACSRVNSALLPAVHTGTQPALGLPDKTWMDLGIQRKRNTMHSKEVQDVGDTMIWEFGSIQRDRWEEGEAQGGRRYFYSSLSLLQGQDLE